MATQGSYQGILGNDIYDPGINFRSNDGFGLRFGPPGSSSIHKGVDYGTLGATGIPVAVALTGTVEKIFEQSNGFGMSVIVRTVMPDGTVIRITYGHVKSISGLSESETIYAGQTIGTVEDRTTLISEGGIINVTDFKPHLHLEIRADGQLQDPYTFNDWQGKPHVIGTDGQGNPLVASGGGIPSDGNYVRTITTFDSITGTYVPAYTESSQSQSNGGFVRILEDTSGQPLVTSWFNEAGVLVKKAYAGGDGQIVTYTQAGIQVVIDASGQKTAYVPGFFDSEGNVLGVVMAANGNITIPSESGGIIITLPEDPFADGMCLVAERTYNFGADDVLSVGMGGLMIQSTGSAQVSDLLIDGTGNATQFNYERITSDNLDPLTSDWGSEGDWELVGTEAVSDVLNGGGALGTEVVNSFDVTVQDQSTTASAPSDPSAWDGLLLSGSGYSVSADESWVNEYQYDGDGFFNNLSYSLLGSYITDGFRPGNNNLSDAGQDLGGLGLRLGGGLGFDYSPDLLGSSFNLYSLDARVSLPVDPLVLDLNGDGVQLTDWLTAPVLFDIDHDGGSKEQTGWVSAEDGMVVMDLNGNGQIDGIHETFSEYFNGAAGADGEAGEKPFANGFAALKSLDSNNDNQFTAADEAWGNVRVWVDADHDGVTDEGELQSLDSLGITSINLASTPQSGLVSGGNEVLATGSFVQNGQTREAIAANFLANPSGQSSQAVGLGVLVSGAGSEQMPATATYVSGATEGETINLTALGAANAVGGSGKRRSPWRWGGATTSMGSSFINDALWRIAA